MSGNWWESRKGSRFQFRTTRNLLSLKIKFEDSIPHIPTIDDIEGVVIDLNNEKKVANEIVHEALCTSIVVDE